LSLASATAADKAPVVQDRRPSKATMLNVSFSDGVRY
jgi:hypothetical protein